MNASHHLVATEVFAQTQLVHINVSVRQVLLGKTAPVSYLTFRNHLRNNMVQNVRLKYSNEL